MPVGRLRAEFTAGYQTATGSAAAQRVERMQEITALRRETVEATKMNASTTPLLNHADTRRILFKLWWAYYDNSVYKSIDEGGYRKLINDRLGSAKVGGLAGLYNPVERASDAYQYVFDGRFGDEIKIDDKQDDGETPVNKKILDPIKKIWKWSNMTDEAEMLCRYTPVLGSCGIRVVMENSTDTAAKRVYLSVEHPNLIRDVEVDSRGNITQLILEYDKLEGSMRDGETVQEWHSYVEYMSREVFWIQKDDQWWNFQTEEFVDTQEEAEVKNLAGFVPYVIVRHRNVGSVFGVPCFYGQDEKIDHINALATHLAQQVHKHVTATWLLEAGGPKPDFITLGDMNIIYVQRELGQTSAAKMEALVANLNIEQAGGLLDRLQGELGNSMPELKATDGEFLSHQSGGTVAQLRTPAEQRILKGRAAIEDAVVKAQKMALSLGVIYNLWDLGTGKGSRAAADAAFSQGKLDHRFNKRPAFPLTVDDKLSMAKADQAKAAAENPNTPSVKGGDNKNQPSSKGSTAGSVGKVGQVGSASANSSTSGG